MFGSYDKKNGSREDRCLLCRSVFLLGIVILGTTIVLTLFQ